MSAALNGQFDEQAPAAGFWRRALPLWLAGSLGVLVLAAQPLSPAVLTALQQAQGGQPVAAWQARLAVISGPWLLLTLVVALGAALAHRVGLRSALAGTWGGARGGAAAKQRWEDAPRRWHAALPGLGLAALLGLALGVVLRALDGLLWPAQALDVSGQRPGLLALRFMLGLVYGGITEEVLMRHGLLALLLWLCTRRRGRGRVLGRPGALTVWLMLVLSALLFALAHVPAAVALGDAALWRVIALNTTAGLFYGLLAWRHSLEAAMVAHAATHAGMGLLAVPAL